MTATPDTPNAKPSANGRKAPPHQGKPAAPKRRRPLRALAWLLLCLSAVLIGIVGWLAFTPSGLRFGLYTLPSWFGVHITSKSLEGTLVNGFHGDDWLIETESADIKISRFRFGWQPSELFRPSLHITEITAGDIAIVTKPVPPKEDTPPSGLPDSIDLPASVYIDRLETGAISIGKNFEQQTVYAEKIQTAYRYDRQEHRLDLTLLKSPWSESAGAVVVGLNKPYTLNTAIYTKGELEGETVHGTLRLWGSLQDVHTDIILDGDNIGLYARSTVRPFAAALNEMLGEVQAKGFNINPSAFLPSLPKARLNFDATVIPTLNGHTALEGSIDLGNSEAGFADNNAIPVRTLLGNFTVDDNGNIHITDAEIELLQKGTINISGNIDTAADRLGLALNLNEVGADDAVGTKIAGRLNGSINVQGTTASPDITWNLDSGSARSTGLLQIATDAQHGQQTLLLDHIKILPQNGGELSASGFLELFQNQALKLDIRSQAFNPAQIDPQLPAGSINGTIALTGELANQRYGGTMQFTPGTLNGVSLSGSADILYENQHFSRALTDLKLGTNVIKTDGSFGKKNDRLNLSISAPDLSRFGFGLSGLLNAKGYIAGDFTDGLKTLDVDINGQARAFRLADTLNIRTLDFKFKGSPDTDKQLAAEFKGEQIILAGDTQTAIDTVNLSVNGTGLNHRIQGGGNMALDGKNYRLEIDASGGLNPEQTQWKGTVGTLNIGGAFNLRLQNRINLEAGAERVAMSPAQWAVMGGSLNLQSFVWDKKTGITSKGSAHNLHMAELHNFYTPPVPHNLVLGGDWDVSYSENARGYLNVSRQGGDVLLPDSNQPLGLSALMLNTRFQNGRIDARLNGNTRFGKADAAIGIAQQFGSNIAAAPLSGKINLDIPDLTPFRTFLPNSAKNLSGSFRGSADLGGRVSSPTVNSTLAGNTNFGTLNGNVNIGTSSNFADAPLSGRLHINVAELETFRSFLPVGQTVKGNLNAAVTLGGRLSEPLLGGTLNGENLYYRNQAQGIILDNGVLRSRLQGQRWVIDSLKFHRGGTVELSGGVSLDNNAPDVDVDIVFDRYRTLSRPNRRLALSGKAKVRYNEAHGVALTGGLKADFGMFGFQNASMPTTDDDVVILGEEHKTQTATTPIYMDLDIDLNDNVRFVAEGLNVTLGGKLKLSARPNETVQGVGSINVVKGSYKAYGQDLEIKKGVISFVGPLTNPNLNIRAERRLSPVGAGVEVLGNLDNPRITLVADEPMSEKDKLSWLILNRASSGSDSDNAALSAAAGALLAGQLNDRVGLVDDIGFTSQQSRNAETGEMNPAEQVLTVGKQLTNELYAGYEFGITSTKQSVKLVYQLTRSLQAVARIGNLSSGGELKYSIRFDTLPWQKKLKAEDKAAEAAERQRFEQQQRERQNP
ncbi:translocation/assembly module TamB domain-containing protein [Neisseria animalis]|uniref:Translocation/assembly module TamB n=1 Tax=Neisseria animalis TaxID=492 RepID=A0A5P3MR02_NEIAN|nr:translocation/assembly module TamB domain-containing protein [Neisseria animalis]QEY23880.1 translocation/assembly module TamB [Neisseria animalis]ROW32052.1 translocation/assembly module TamB [Neisseria animalis]VEE05777.1 Periplasmic protein [Neisseria animalis]